jgi:glc operon protein GlcG
MTYTMPHLKLSAEGALKVLGAAAEKAKEIGVPVSISVVDDGGNLLAFTRMDGAKLHSIDTSRNKAVTAASIRVPTGSFPAGPDLKVGLATNGKFINLKGGVPILIDGHLVGGVGAGSGTGDEDLEIVLAGLLALPGAKRWDNTGEKESA